MALATTRTDHALAFEFCMTRERCVCSILGERGVKSGITFDCIVETFEITTPALGEQSAQVTLRVLSNHAAVLAYAQQVQAQPALFEGLTFEVHEDREQHVTLRDIRIEIDLWRIAIAFAPKTV